MNQSIDRQAYMVRAVHLARALAKTIYPQIPPEILEKEDALRGLKETASWATTVDLFDALDALMPKVATWAITDLWAAEGFSKDIVSMLPALWKATNKIVGNSVEVPAVLAFQHALFAQRIVAESQNLAETDITQTNRLLRNSILSALQAGIAIDVAVCEATSMDSRAWPIFATLVADGHDIFQAVEEAELLSAHQ